MARGRPDYTLFEFGSETVATEDTIIRHTAQQISGGGNVAFLHTLVAVGHAMELNHVYAVNSTSATPLTAAYIISPMASNRITQEINVATNVPVMWTGKVWMAAGDYIMMYFTGTAAGDNLLVSAFGKDVIRR